MTTKEKVQLAELKQEIIFLKNQSDERHSEYTSEIELIKKDVKSILKILNELSGAKKALIIITTITATIIGSVIALANFFKHN